MNGTTSPSTPAFRKACRDGFVVCRAGLMDEPDVRLPQRGPRLLAGLIEGSRTLTSASDEHGEAIAREAFPARTAKNSCLTGKPVTSIDACGKVFRGLLKRQQHLASHAAETAVRDAGHGIRFHDRHRQAEHSRSSHHGGGDISAHAEDSRCRTGLLQDPASRPDARREFDHGRDRAAPSDALEAADLDPIDGESGCGDELRFHPQTGSNKKHIVADLF